MSIGKPLHLRLFLEGQEVPVISAQVSINLNSPAAAAIQVVPLDEAVNLKPRTMVHLFFLEQPGLTDQHGGGVASIALDEARKDQYYKLLFAGEIIGFSFVKTPLSRAVVLQCLDFSSYWDTAQATAMEYDANGNAFTNKAALFGSDASLFDDIVNHQSEKLVQWVRSTPKTPGLQNVTGLAGGIIRMMEVMGGVTSNHQKGVNDFFTIGELRCRLLAQVAAEENDDTAARLLSTQVFHEWLLNGLQNIGQQVSLRDIMKYLCQYVYYDIVPNPAAKYDKADKLKKKTTERTERVGNTPDGLKARSILNEVYTELTNIPTLNNQDSTSIRKRAADLANSLDKKATPLLLKLGTTGKSIINIYTPAMNTLMSISKTYGSADARAPKWDDFRDTVGKAVDTLDNKETKIKTKSTQTTFDHSARLKTQILRPDVFMAAPPRCNVVFPEVYTNLTYDRVYIGEVTRILILLYNTLVGSGDATTDLLSTKVLAPLLTDEAKALAKKVGSGPYRLLMPHELHTGIIPRIEWLPDMMGFLRRAKGGEAVHLKKQQIDWVMRTAMHHFYKYRIGSRQASVAGRFNPYMVCGFPALVITRPFFFDGGPTNLSSQQILEMIHDTKSAADIGMPPQLIGMVVGLTHTVGQDGGQTQFSMTHVRYHLGIDDEFVGVILDSVKSTSSKKRIKYILDAHELTTKATGEQAIKGLKLLAAATPPAARSSVTSSKKTKEVGSTPIQHSVTTIEDGKRVVTTVTSNVPTANERDQSTESLQYVKLSEIDRVEGQVYVPHPPGNKTRGSSGLYGGNIVGIEVAPPYAITEEYGTRMFERIIVYEDIKLDFSADVPVEDVVRPSWMSPVYDNENIGNSIYQPFFGCDSVIDGVEIITPEGDRVTTASVSPRGPEEGESVDVTDPVADLKDRLKSEAKTRALLSTERAVNTLSYLYGLVRSEKLDVDEFIRSYTWRPIATQEEVLGSSDLQAKVSGNKVEITKGSVGFHTLALFSDGIMAGNLTGLLEDPDLGFTRADNTGKKETIPPSYDVRKEKLGRVLEYKAALERGKRAFSG